MIHEADIRTPLETFKADATALIENHHIVRKNRYTQSFANGNASLDELREFTVQFSVFSHLFLEAQLRKCINAHSIESYRAGKEILLNELGVTFARSGSIEGGTFRFRAGHFEWLAGFAEAIGLRWTDIGKRKHGSPATLHFCDAFTEWYASDDESTAAGASYAIEHWAAAGFWKDLITGLRRINQKHSLDLPLGFWTWHDAIEDQHASHTNDELLAVFATENFNETNFLRAAKAMLDAVATFWHGLEPTTTSLEVCA